MIFQFPDLDTFHLAVTSSQVPPEVSAAPAEVAFDPEGRPSVRSASGIPSKPMQNALKKLGVKSAKDHYSETILTVDCWPQILAVAKHAGLPDVTSNTPVLFEMPLAEMPTVVSEMLRLGNDRQSFRTLANLEGKSERVLLRVVGPPYYTLLRAIDKSTQKGATITAYLEKAPSVWVEIGHEHPLAGQIKPAEGQVLLLRPEREWSIVEDAPFQDVYDVLDFKLPTASVEWQESQLKGKLVVPLRLVPGNAADVPELWVLTENAVDQLDALVRDADERLLARLLFAVIEDGDRKSIILKTRPSKLSPPVLALEQATGFKPFWKLPNLFVPVASRIMPTLRRDAVRKLLAEDPAQIVWLMPTGEGKFATESLPDDSFRPLEDWIDYVLDHEHAALQAWMLATRFDFDAFVCPEDMPDRPKGPPPEKGKRNKKGAREEQALELESAPPPAKPTKKGTSAADECDFQLATEAIPPNQVKIRLRELENAFLADEGSLDSKNRQAIWPEMAQLNGLDGRELEAAICWSNAFWELPEVPISGAWSWLQGEDARSQKVPTDEEFELALGNNLPSPNEVRTLVARVIYACRLETVPQSLVERLPGIREYLEKNEGALGARAIWLAWWHITRVNADDLALVRVRDRLLQRLLAEGLNKERDLPYFLRTAGEQNSDRMRQIRDRAMKVHKLVEKWHTGEDVKVNKPYVDLMFAFGLAKLGEVTAARDLMKTATDALLEPASDKEHPDPAHEFLVKAFLWRIENALQGKPHAGPLPPDMLRRLESIDEGRSKQGVANPRYIVDRMRDQSWVLEPQDKTDPYWEMKRHGSEAQKLLAELVDVRVPGRISETVRKYARANQPAEIRILAYHTGISLGHRVDEEFTTTLIHNVPALLQESTRTGGPKEFRAQLGEWERKLITQSLRMAAHYDRAELVQKVFQCFMDIVKSLPESERYEAVSEISREGLRSLRRMGLRDEIDGFLAQLKECIVADRTLPQMRAKAGTRWQEVLSSLLALAEGWLFFGGAAQAKPLLDEARLAIVEHGRTAKQNNIAATNLTKLVRSYVAAIAQCPVEEALDRIDDLLRNLQSLPNTYTTSSHYSRLHLNIVEDIIRSLTSDNLAIGDQARRWLDDDEYLVRRRIHADMRSVLSRNGIS